MDNLSIIKTVKEAEEKMLEVSVCFQGLDGVQRLV